MSPTLTILLLCIGIPLLLICAGIAICSHFGPDFFDGYEDPLDKWAREVGLSSGSDDPHP